MNYLITRDRQLKIYFRECNTYFSYMHLRGLYTVAKFQIHRYNTFREMNNYPVTDRRTDGQTDGQKAIKRCIWAHRAICTGGLKNHSSKTITDRGLNLQLVIKRVFCIMWSCDFQKGGKIQAPACSVSDKGPSLRLNNFSVFQPLA